MSCRNSLLGTIWLRSPYTLLTVWYVGVQRSTSSERLRLLIVVDGVPRGGGGGAGEGGEQAEVRGV